MPGGEESELIPGATGNDHGRLTAKQFAERHGVTAQTVINWIKAGTVPGTGGTGEDGTRRPYTLDAKAADAALAAHRRGNGHGGTRPKAGRPAGSKDKNARRKNGKTGTPQNDRGPTLSPIETLAEIGRRAEAGEMPANPMRVVELLNLERSELEAVVLIADPAGLSQQKLDWLRTVEDIRKRKRENDEAEGRLVDAEQARAAFAETHTRVRTRLEGVARKAAGPVASVAWVTAEAVDAIADLIRSTWDNDNPDDTVAAVRGLLDKPDDLEPAIVTLIEREIDHARCEISEQG